MTQRPDLTEHAPYQVDYISLVPEGNILTILDQQGEKTRYLFANLNEADGEKRYAPGKWTIKEVLGHIIDTERIMAYRALRISRNDQTPLPGFEQDDYVKYGPFANCEMMNLLEEFNTVRRSTILMFSHLDYEAWMRRGRVWNYDVTTRALAYIIAGHELHHRKILKERYL